jgi:hypothetical protein
MIYAANWPGMIERGGTNFRQMFEKSVCGH